ncbi:MAG: hypothetical protein HWE14_12765 [Flavobacteriia bacterium]|nr:hypothetical protein [Flavobacteriia bacterium]
MNFKRCTALLVLILSTWTIRGQINYDSWSDLQVQWGSDDVQQVAEMSIRHRWKYIDFNQQLFRYSFQHTKSETYRRDRGGAIVPASANYQFEFDIVELRYFDGWRLGLGQWNGIDFHLYLRNEVRGFFEWSNEEYERFVFGDRLRVRPELSANLWQSVDEHRSISTFLDAELLGSLFYHPSEELQTDMVSRYRLGLSWRVSRHWKLESSYTFEQSLDGGSHRGMGRMAVVYAI